MNNPNSSFNFTFAFKCLYFWKQLAEPNDNFVLGHLQGSRALNYPRQQLPYCWITVHSHLLRKKYKLGWTLVGSFVDGQTKTPLCLSSCRAFFPRVDVWRQPGDSALQPRRPCVQETTPVRLPRRQRSHLHQVSGSDRPTSSLLRGVITQLSSCWQGAVLVSF